MDHRADIYSLGVVIYEMLTGELPLGRFPSPSQRAAVDARIDEIVLKTLKKERDLRQQSATEVKADMHRAMQPGQASVSKPANHAESPRSSGMAKTACWLMSVGTLLLSISVFPEVGILAVLFALVHGIITWRERLGKFTALASPTNSATSSPSPPGLVPLTRNDGAWRMQSAATIPNRSGCFAS